jgi:hypothetical protein
MIARSKQLKKRLAAKRSHASGFQTVADVPCEKIDWLWPHLVPLGKVTILEGDPDEGKSLISLDLAARTSSGEPMPLQTGGRNPAAVVILSAEDAVGDTIRPRLQAADADLKRISVIRGDRLPTIPHGLDEIAQEVRLTGARLLIIDPLAAFVDGHFDLHRDQDARNALTPLVALAREENLAVLLIRHLRKSEGGHARYRGLGSVGIVGVSRSALLLAHDPVDRNKRVLAPVKGNLTGRARAVSLSLEAHGDSVRVEWYGHADNTADDLLARLAGARAARQLDQAKDLLRTELSGGERTSDELVIQARKAGITDITLRRARRALGVRVRREGFGADGAWLCSLDQEGDHEAV